MHERGDPIYREYLENESNENIGYFNGIKSFGWQLGRFALLKYGEQAILHPFHSTIVLRQIYCVEPRIQDSAPIYDQGEKARNSQGYFVDEKCTPSLRLLSIDSSVWSCMGNITRNSGFSSMWLGMHASWSFKVISEASSVLINEFCDELCTKLSKDRLSKTYQENSKSSSTISNILTLYTSENGIQGMTLGLSMFLNGMTGLLLSPFEANSIHSIILSSHVKSKRYSITRCLNLHPLYQFLSHAASPILQRIPVCITNLMMAQLFNGYGMIGDDNEVELSIVSTIFVFLMQGLLQCVPLIITIPIGTIRRRLLAQECFVSNNSHFIESNNDHSFKGIKMSENQMQSDKYMELFSSGVIPKSKRADACLNSPSFNCSGGFKEASDHHNCTVLNKCDNSMIDQYEEDSSQRISTEASKEYGSLFETYTRVPISKKKYRNAFNCAWRMIREEGLNSLYRGWGIQVGGVLISYVSVLISQIGVSTIDELADDDEF